ncbi:MAG: hypothetical protein P9M06_01125 [Candidatus Saelkia tenebricola]|nr:hypothetical protein [Candidatus Saelkia tenebricola]
MNKKNEGLALLLTIFLMLLFSLFAMMLASVFANRTEIAKGFYRMGQTFSINDMGIERAKQKLYDDWSWRTAGLEEDVDIGDLNGYYTIVVTGAAGDPVEISIESEIVK